MKPGVVNMLLVPPCIHRSNPKSDKALLLYRTGNIYVPSSSKRACHRENAQPRTVR